MEGGVTRISQALEWELLPSQMQLREQIAPEMRQVVLVLPLPAARPLCSGELALPWALCLLGISFYISFRCIDFISGSVSQQITYIMEPARSISEQTLFPHIKVYLKF